MDSWKTFKRNFMFASTLLFLLVFFQNCQRPGQKAIATANILQTGSAR